MIQICVIDKNGVRIEQPVHVPTKWDYKGYVNRANEVLHTY